MNKTLIGKNNFLFLINDTNNEILNHCKEKIDNDEIILINNKVNNLTFKNYLLIVIPDKSYFYKEYLPDEYNAIFRKRFDLFKQKLNNRIQDMYLILEKNKKNDLLYYKTDTHINFLGNYYIYKHFIKLIKSQFNIDVKPKNINIQKKKCNLLDLNIGIGDLLWPSNCKLEHLNKDNYDDIYYFSDDINYLYMKYIISDSKDLRLLDYSKNLNDFTKHLEGQLLTWDIITKYIIYKENKEIKQKFKIIIFYDSMLLNILDFYLNMFYEVFMIKTIYDKNLINYIKPDYVFEFKIERFL